MNIDQKYIILAIALIVFMWRLFIFPKLRNKKVANIDFIDALFHLIVISSGFFILDNNNNSASTIKKTLNYIKTPAEF
jgi:hypothetical protein